MNKYRNWKLLRKIRKLDSLLGDLSYMGYPSLIYEFRQKLEQIRRNLETK
jgi:hypothetical protein